MAFEPIQGKALRIPPGRVEIRLTEEHKRLYRRLYARFRTVTEGLPVLRDNQFDGRAVRVSRTELETLNQALAAEAGRDLPAPSTGSVFEAQADGRSRLFKRLQYLS